MRLLQLCRKFPYPLKDGEAIAVNSLSSALARYGCEITLLAMNTEKHYSEVPEYCSELAHYTDIETVYVDNTLNAVDAFVDLISGKSYNISRFDSAKYREKLAKMLKANDYDIVQLESSYLSIYVDTIKENSNAKIVLRSHNLEYEIWERIAENTKRGLKSWYLNKCAERLFQFEVNQLGSYDLLVSITDKDLQKYYELGYNKEGISSPAGLNLDQYKMKPIKKEMSLSFIGSLDWIPNLNGLKWFINNVWPIVSKKNPDLKFHVAGRNLDTALNDISSPNLIVEGEVPCAKEFISDHNIMIVPLFSGSGIRVKILEGLSMGKTVISTSLGAEGIIAENGEHLLLADDVQQFVEAIQYCISEPEILEDFKIKGRKLIETKYSNIDNAEKLVKAYKKLLGITTKTSKIKPQV